MMWLNLLRSDLDGGPRKIQSCFSSISTLSSLNLSFDLTFDRVYPEE